MLFDENEIIPKKIQVTPRVCDGGELLAIWILAYGKTAATHLWDIGVSRAFSNTAEIDIAIAREMKRTREDELTCARRMILKSGVYEIKTKPETKQSIEVSPELASTLQAAADRDGISVEQYLQKMVSGNDS